MFRIDIDNDKSFKKDLEKLNKDLKSKKKIKRYLEFLSQNPFSNFLNTKKLEPKQIGKFRLKVDNYRVIYSIDFGNKILIIHRIGFRKDIYK